MSTMPIATIKNMTYGNYYFCVNFTSAMPVVCFNYTPTIFYCRLPIRPFTAPRPIVYYENCCCNTYPNHVAVLNAV